MEQKEEIGRLLARVDDLIARAEHGEVAVSAFLSPREFHFASRRIKESRASFFAFGGYDDAERKRVYILPDYMEGEASVTLLEDYEISAQVSALRVSGSGFSKLSHRDFLGSLLGLGLERSVIGDIIVTEEGKEAVVFCDTAISPFLLDAWIKAGNDKIRVERISLPENFAPLRRFAQISDTVASPRIDAIVGALCSLSRDKSRELVEDECVEVDYETTARPDRTVIAPCLVTVRGCGKFRINQSHISVSRRERDAVF